MLSFIFRRLLWGIPSLLAVFCLCFLMLDSKPEQMIDTYLGNNIEGSKGTDNIKQYEEYYCQASKKLGYDKPSFYFSISNVAEPDTLQRICYLPQRILAKKLLEQSGNWPAVQAYFNSIDVAFNYLASHPFSDLNASKYLQSEIFSLKSDFHLPEIIAQYASTDSLDDHLKAILLEINHKHLQVQNSFANKSMLIPRFQWNGADNRFHKMFTSIFSKKENISLVDSRPAWDKISEALSITLSINFVSIIIALLLAVWLAIRLNMISNPQISKSIEIIIFALYTIPAFWVGSLFLTFFSNASYSPYLNWFPVGGLGDISGSTHIFEIFLIRLQHLILPIFCVAYPATVYLTLHLRDSLSLNMKKQYLLTALSKGMTRKDALKKHVLKNSIFPIISILGHIIPSLFAGSVVIEILFNLPGMGRLAYQSIISRDWPVFFDIIFISGLITILAQILVDIAYQLLDPRIKLNNEI